MQQFLLVSDFFLVRRLSRRSEQSGRHFKIRRRIRRRAFDLKGRNDPKERLDNHSKNKASWNVAQNCQLRSHENFEISLEIHCSVNCNLKLIFTHSLLHSIDYFVFNFIFAIVIVDTGSKHWDLINCNDNC